MRRALVTVAIGILALAGCGADDTATSDTSDAPTASAGASESADDASESPTPEQSAPPEQEAVEVEIEGSTITPNGRRLEVEAGEPITLDITSDRSGELHVHAKPEQELDVKKGSSTIDLTIDTPGVVDVEEHESGVVILQLEVR
jgi:glucose/arabinose dehydrogenase